MQSAGVGAAIEVCRSMAQPITADISGRETGKTITRVALRYQNPASAPDELSKSVMKQRIADLGESVLLPQYCGHGIGRRFFDCREAYAHACGMQYATFCAVAHDSEDPRRPTDDHPLNRFWKKRCYIAHSRIKATFDWQEIGQSVESPHTLNF